MTPAPKSNVMAAIIRSSPVWQMAEDDYRFGLMQGTNREKTLEEKMALKGATAEEMALILSTFDIEGKDIFVIPWQNPASSYMVTVSRPLSVALYSS